MAWKVLRPVAEHSRLYRTRARFPVVVAGRGSGKSEIARRRLVRRLAEYVPTTSEPMYFYGLPTYSQARRVAWKPLKNLIPPEWIIGRPNESGMFIKTIFGSELHVMGFDKPQRFEGSQWAGGVLDECSDQRPKIFDLTIRPALTEHNGSCWRIGVPKRYGIGAEEFKAAWDAGLLSPDADNESYHWMSEKVVAHDELERIKATLDERDYSEQYCATWEKTSGAIFYAFEKAHNVSSSAEFNPSLPIVVGSDFNVNPMCWCLGHQTPNGLKIFDELKIRNTNTRETLDILSKKYGDHGPGYLFFGDASGRARKTSASETDYIQIVNCPHFTKKKVHYLKGNPPLVNRFASCNALLKNAKGERNLIIHPRCKRLIADLEHRSYKEKSREPNDHGDMGHMSDGLGYIVYRLHPLRIVEDSTNPVIIHA